MQYQGKLPDHDFVVTPDNKLTARVLLGLTINEMGKPDGAVTTSGPTYIAIRSGKHDSSVAATYAADLRHLYADILWSSGRFCMGMTEQ